MADVIILSGMSPTENYVPRISRSLGPYRVASTLIKEGYTVKVIDYIQYMSSEEILSSIKKYLDTKTLWVGFSSSFFIDKAMIEKIDKVQKLYQTRSVDDMHSLYDYVKAHSSAKIVYGGSWAINNHSDPKVDYYVAGYGDVASLDLTNYLAGKKELDHFSKLETDSILIDSGKYPEPEMSSLETFWHEFDLLPNESVPLEFARGCIFKCKFCAYPLLGKKKGTYIRDMSQVRDELTKLWETKGIDSFYITDDTFNDDNDKMEEFHKLFTSLPFKPKFSAFLRLDLIDRFPHQAELLTDAGLVGTFFGVESLNHKSARCIGKGLHPDKVKRRLSLLKDQWKGKVNMSMGLIMGLPYDDESYFTEIYDYITSPDYPVQATSFNPLVMVDKTKSLNLYSSEFTKNPEIYGYSFDEQGWVHKEQNLTFTKCLDIANYFNSIKRDEEYVADFGVTTYLNLGIDLHDIMRYNIVTLHKKYDIPKLNNENLMMYKQMIGAI
jgi:radical SAM superfamily enzyme YgiQ (UPF0313 family)